MSRSKILDDFELKGRPSRVTFHDSEGVPHEFDLTVIVTQIAENLDKPKNGTERFSIGLEWRMTAVRKVVTS